MLNTTLTSINVYTRLIRCTAIASLICLMAACSARQPKTVATTPTPAASTIPAPKPRTAAVPSNTAKVDPFASAEDKAISAANLAQNASTIEDWELVKSKLQQAIALIKTVPANSPKRAIAQKRQAVYQQQIKVAQQQRQKLAKGNSQTLRASAQSESSKLTASAGNVPVVSGSGFTLENYERVEFGMSPDEVRSILGKPTHQQGSPPDFSWTWESPDQKRIVGVGFSENKVVTKVSNTNS